MNYFLDDRINNAAVLFPGVGCFLIAACLGSWLHASNVADIDKKLGIKRGGDVIDRYVISSHPNRSRALWFFGMQSASNLAAAAAAWLLLLLLLLTHFAGLAAAATHTGFGRQTQTCASCAFDRMTSTP